jgi:hypothetical protein
MTFDKAYCQEFNGNITAYKARREYFAQGDINYKFTFFCPDENCNVELTSVNIMGCILISNHNLSTHFFANTNKYVICKMR